jgi:hypothetical protein
VNVLCLPSLWVQALPEPLGAAVEGVKNFLWCEVEDIPPSRICDFIKDIMRWMLKVGTALSQECTVWLTAVAWLSMFLGGVLINTQPTESFPVLAITKGSRKEAHPFSAPPSLPFLLLLTPLYRGNTLTRMKCLVLFFFKFLFYSYVHTMFGSFLPLSTPP